MNSHQIAKEILLDEEDANFIHQSSSFLTGNTGMHNTGSIRRELSEQQLFARAVEEVERARARMLTQQEGAVAAAAPKAVGARRVSSAESEGGSDEYSEKYDSDFSADSIDTGDTLENRSNALACSRDHRIISDVTEDYEDDYHDYEDQEKDLNTSCGEAKQGCHEKEKESCSANSDDESVFQMLTDLVDDPEEHQEQRGEEDREHERSILKRLAEAHEQRSPSRTRLGGTALPSTNYFDPDTRQRAKRPSDDHDHDHDPDNLDPLLLAEELGGPQYAQLKSDDTSFSSYHFSEPGKNSNSPSCAPSGKHEMSLYSKFSSSTASHMSSHPTGPREEYGSIGYDGDNGNAGTFSGSLREDNSSVLGPLGTVAASATAAAGPLSENRNIEFLVAGGLDEWLVMNMKQNTKTALRSMKPHDPRHNLLVDSDNGETLIRSPHSLELATRFSVCTEVYQHLLAEAQELERDRERERGVREVAERFTGEVLDMQNVDQQGGGESFPPPKSPGMRRRHSAKAKDDFEVGPGGSYSADDDWGNEAMHRSDSKVLHRQRERGRKLTSASMQLENCVSRLEGGRHGESRTSGDSKGAEGGHPGESEDQRRDRSLGPGGGQESDRGTEGATRLGQSLGRARKQEGEGRRRNRRVLFAAMQLGSLAGQLVMERSRSVDETSV